MPDGFRTLITAEGIAMALPRIPGTETEYGIIGRLDPDVDPLSRPLLLIDDYQNAAMLSAVWDRAREHPRCAPHAIALEELDDVPDRADPLSINKVLTDGARYDLDHAHPEYSTPECTNLRHLTRDDKAGDRILDMRRSRAEQALAGGQRLLIRRNNSDHKGHSCGYHENHLLDRETPGARIVEDFRPFPVTRQISCGAGEVGAANGTEPAPYRIAQRANVFETEVGLDTVVKRPLLNPRDEAHACRERDRRRHVIAGDAKMSEYTLDLQVGMTAIVLGMSEDESTARSFALGDPAGTVKAVSRDPTCQRPIRLEDGRTLSLLALQGEDVGFAQRDCATHPVAPWAVDWVMKWRLSTSSMDRHRDSWESARVAMLDVQYRDIRRDNGLCDVLERHGEVERIVSDAEIDAAVDAPPLDRRAYRHGMGLKRFPHAGLQHRSGCSRLHPCRRRGRAFDARGSTPGHPRPYRRGSCQRGYRYRARGRVSGDERLGRWIT
jgi:proteasome accessory factor A